MKTNTFVINMYLFTNFNRLCQTAKLHFLNTSFKTRYVFLSNSSLLDASYLYIQPDILSLPHLIIS